MQIAIFRVLCATFRMSTFAKNKKYCMKTSIDVAFGKRVAELRRKQNISQEDFAELCGVHRTYIGALERGEKSPTLNTIEKVSKGLQISIVELFNF